MSYRFWIGYAGFIVGVLSQHVQDIYLAAGIGFVGGVVLGIALLMDD